MADEPTALQLKLLGLLSKATGGVLRLRKLKEARGSFGIFREDERQGDHLFHPSAVLSAFDKGLLGGGPLHGYFLTEAGERALREAAHA